MFHTVLILSDNLKTTLLFIKNINKLFRYEDGKCYQEYSQERFIDISIIMINRTNKSKIKEFSLCHKL